MAMAQITRWYFRMIARPLFFRGAKIPSIGFSPVTIRGILRVELLVTDGVMATAF